MLNELSPSSMLLAFENEIRRKPIGAPAGYEILQNKDLIRFLGPNSDASSNKVKYLRFDGDVDAQIEDQVCYFARHQRELSWDVYDHDYPESLRSSFEKHGFKVDSSDHLLMMDLSQHPSEEALPNQVLEVNSEASLLLLEPLLKEVWKDAYSWVKTILNQAVVQSKADFRIYAYLLDQKAVSGGWMRLHEGTSFASLWGGMTLPAHRSQGYYREMVRYRCSVAKSLGKRYIYVEAMETSLPTLLKCGFQPISQKTTYVRSCG